MRIIMNCSVPVHEHQRSQKLECLEWRSVSDLDQFCCAYDLTSPDRVFDLFDMRGLIPIPRKIPHPDFITKTILRPGFLC